MKKIEYNTPEMEVIKLKMQGNVLLSTSSDETPGFSDTPAGDPYAG